MKENSIETLKKELEEKEKIFEEKYINNVHNDYLSEEAWKLRKDIWRLQSEIIEKEREENNIKEAIERLEKRIKDIWFSTTYSQEQEEKDLKILLSDYKRVLKENEELEEINNELEAEKNEAIRRYNFETIPIKKIKDKIEDLKMSGGSDGKDNTENTARELAIEALQDILEESEE